MIKNPKHFLFGNDIQEDIINLIHDMNWNDMNWKETEKQRIKINSITLTKYFDKWTYYINYTTYSKEPFLLPPDEVKSNINFYTSERDKSLDNKIEQYLDNYLIQLDREEKIKELGIL